MSLHIQDLPLEEGDLSESWQLISDMPSQGSQPPSDSFDDTDQTSGGTDGHGLTSQISISNFYSHHQDCIATISSCDEAIQALDTVCDPALSLEDQALEHSAASTEGKTRESAPDEVDDTVDTFRWTNNLTLKLIARVDREVAEQRVAELADVWAAYCHQKQRREEREAPPFSGAEREQLREKPEPMYHSVYKRAQLAAEALKKKSKRS